MTYKFTEDTWDDLIYRLESILKNKTYSGEVDSSVNPVSGKVEKVTITISLKNEHT